MAEDFQERTEAPTPKRLRDARKKGQVPRSRELSAWLVVTTGSLGIMLFGGSWAALWVGSAREAFAPDSALHLEGNALLSWLGGFVSHWLLALAPFAAMMIVAGLSAPLLLGGWNFSGQALLPQAKRLNPAQGLKRIFGAQGAIEAVKALAKFTVVAAVALLFASQTVGKLLNLAAGDSYSSMRAGAEILAHGLLACAMGLALIALFDVPIQLLRFSKQLRMTRQEIKDENKQEEGDPMLRARVRQVQRDMAQRRMMSAVPEADVIVVNPTHYSVALKYESHMVAPTVVAKGTDLMARRIRELGAEHQVAVVESPLLARALYYSAELDQQIPQGLFVAVAQVLAFVYQLRHPDPAVAAAAARPTAADAAVPDEFVELVRKRGGTR